MNRIACSDFLIDQAREKIAGCLDQSEDLGQADAVLATEALDWLVQIAKEGQTLHYPPTG